MQHGLITFGIAGQRFGIDIMAVREIRAWSPVTRLPRVPDYVAGVLNLRGAVLPVIDLAARLGWAPTAASARNPIVVVDHHAQVRGFIVHEVSDIVSLDPGIVQQVDTHATDQVTPFLKGVAPFQNEMVMLLDLHRLIVAEEHPLAA